MPDQIKIQILFTRTTDSGLVYSDALLYTQDEYAALTPEEITAAEDARFQAWQDFIANPPTPAPAAVTTYTKFGFRQRFTTEELIAVDNYDSNPNVPYEARAVIKSFLFSFQVAEEIDTTDPATVAGVQFLESVGLIASGRAAEILGV